jgi:hypothetical protein
MEKWPPSGPFPVTVSQRCGSAMPLRIIVNESKHLLVGINAELQYLFSTSSSPFVFHGHLSYTMETPSRFKKELLYPYASNGAIPVDELNKLLVNIGYGDLCLSSQEQLELLRQAGSSGRDIPMKEILELID